MEEKDFEEMRNQIAILKEKLNKEEIVNDRLLKQSMRSKVSIINRMAWRQYACVVLVCIMFPVFYYQLHLSLAFVSATIALMLFCAGATWYVNRPLNSPCIYSQDVSTTVATFARVKHQYHIWLVYFTPTLMIPWIAWYCYEYTTAMHLSGRIVWIMCGFIVFCAIVGFLIGLVWHRRATNACQDVIDQLQA